jgi:hypothetical protein
MIKKEVKIFFSFFLLVFFSFSFAQFVEAENLGEIKNFYIDSSYDFYRREELSAVLVLISDKLYFYLDNSWWHGLPFEEKNKIKSELISLAEEFERKIYPNLTSNFGSEPKPGIDGKERIFVLVHPMIKEAGGYSRSGDLYSRFIYPLSNEKEIIYLNGNHLDKPLAKVVLAHEFMHLITLNQKELVRGVKEETWLNEAFSEYSATFLGYDANFSGSNLERRLKDFLKNPNDSLTEWLNKEADYGAVNLFVQYLVDQYGLKILQDSLTSSKAGILAINEALAKNGFREDFSQVFTDWTIALLINDCSLGIRYCYKNPNLKNLKIIPQTYFLPVKSSTTMVVNQLTKNWAGNWQRIIGGGGSLVFEFENSSGKKIRVPYLLCDNSDFCQVKFLNLDEKNQKGKLVIPDFNKNYVSLTILPSFQENNSTFENLNFSWKGVNLLEGEKSFSSSSTSFSCQALTRNLFFGLRNDREVRCLQEFLKDQGFYPEGLITGNFLSLTRAAVIRFQEKYKDEILMPLGLKRGTGYVGERTRIKINQLFGNLSESF